MKKVVFLLDMIPKYPFKPLNKPKEEINGKFKK